MLGTNDTEPYFGVNAGNIAAGAGRLVDMVQRSSFGPGKTAPKVLLISPIRIFPSDYMPYLFREEQAEKSKGFPKAFKAIAEQYGCYFLDAAQYAMPDPADGVHLDAAGHAALAQGIYEKVKEIFA